MTDKQAREIDCLKAEIVRLNDNATDDMRVIAMLLKENNRLRTKIASLTPPPAHTSAE